jgi:type II secretory pathway component GspD/PulD (secretin)
LGWAFKWNSTLKDKNNLLIFLTVAIVRSDSDVKDIYTVYGGKYGGETYKMMIDEEEQKWNKTKEGSYGSKVKKFERTVASEF